MSRKPTTTLIILDGWGINPDPEGNAIAQADTPTWDHLIASYPNSRIATSGTAVGLPDGQMGNSEVGHMNLGAGRIVYQNYSRINRAIETGTFAQNSTLCGLIDSAIQRQGAMHLLGLLSSGGVHSHTDHIKAACELAVARGIERLYVHAFLDGRDTPPRSAMQPILDLEQHLETLGVGHVASLIGRYYAMDRDNRWDRIEMAYRLIVDGTPLFKATTAEEALSAAYDRGENDEFVSATAVGEKSIRIEPEDALLFMNFRPDRARELCQALVGDHFDAFSRSMTIPADQIATLTQYEDTLPIPVAFPPRAVDNGLGEYLSSLGKQQLRIAETEKYAHVTFFFNGGREQPYPGEERSLVPSPKVASYDLKPEMSALEVTAQLTAAIASGRYDLIVCNYANGDMVGHTGDFNSAVKAVEALDRCLDQVVETVVECGGTCLITADHGNAEQMLDAETGQPHTAHTLGPVPLVYIGRNTNGCTLADGSLQDIAPTLLTLLNLDPPDEMEGKSLISCRGFNSPRPT